MTANCLHPGVIATNLLSDYMGKPRAVGFLSRLAPGARQGRAREPPPRDGHHPRNRFRQVLQGRGQVHLGKTSYDAETGGPPLEGQRAAGLSP